MYFFVFLGHLALTPNIYDVGAIVQGGVCLDKLDPAEKIKYLENHFHPSADYQHFHTQVIKKGNQPQKTLRFQSSWLETYNWLVYSPLDNGGYCKFCVLFPPKNTRLSTAVLVNRAFQNLQKAKGQFGVLDQHEQRDYHKNAVTEGKLFTQTFRKPEKHVDALLNKRRKELYDSNVHVVKSIIEAVALCGKQNLALRGHRDDNTSVNSNTGNFRAILKLLGTRDPILRKHLQSGKKNCQYTSKTVQNQIIDLIAVYIRNQITKDLKEGKHSKYFSVLADEVTDTTTNKEVLTLCLRFLSGTDRANISISEAFVDFIPLERTTGRAIADAIMKSLHDNGFDIENLRGQGYDGASAMSSSRQGVNGRIREVAPKALYSHCKSHILNLSISSSCKQLSIRNMIGSLNEVYLFFANSPKRQAFFEKILALTECPSTKKKLQGLCKTRWAERHSCYDTFHELYSYITTTLDAMLRPHDYRDLFENEEWSWDPDTRTKAQGLHSTLLSFDFIIAFLVAKKGLEPIRPVTMKLQRSNLDSYEAYEMIDSTRDRILASRNNIDDEFSEWFKEASELAESVGGVVSKPRVSRRQQHRNNAPAETPEGYYRKNVAIPFLDHLLQEMETRFDQGSRTCSAIFQLIPKLMESTTDMNGLCQKLLFWKTDLPSPLSLLSELKYWKTHHSQSDLLITNLIDCLRCCDPDVFPNIYELLCIGCVSPVGSCEGERSFSGLRRIKTYLRNSMTVERLSGLALMNMHHSIDINFDVVLKMFIENNSRRLFSGNILYDD